MVPALSKCRTFGPDPGSLEPWTRVKSASAGLLDEASLALPVSARTASTRPLRRGLASDGSRGDRRALRRSTVSPGRGTSGDFSFDNANFDFRSLRLNTVLRWEWRPGSALFAVWTQAREDSSNPTRSDVGSSLDDLFAAPQHNVFVVKATFRIGG